MSFDCCVLQPIRSRGGVSHRAVTVKLSPVLASGPIRQLTCLLTRSPYLCRTAFSAPGCLYSWGPCAESKYLNRLQSFTGLNLSWLRENKHSKIERRLWVGDVNTFAFLLQSVWTSESYTAKSIYSLYDLYVTTVLAIGKIDIFISFYSSPMFCVLKWT